MATKVNTGKKGGSKMFWIIGGLVLIAGGVGAYFLLRKPKDDTNTNTDVTDDGDKDKSTDGGGNTGSGSVSSSVSAPADLNSADQIKAFQDWMDAQGKGWINKDGKWVLLNKENKNGEKKVTTKVVFMRILVVYCFCTPTVKPRLWLMSYQRNRNNFDFFVQLALLILRGQWG